MTLVAYGVLVGKYHWFPHDQFVSAKKTALTLARKIRGQDNDGDVSWIARWVDIKPKDASSNRIRFVAEEVLDDPIMFSGGKPRYNFAESCPVHGCLAVEYAPTGEVTHAYPYRPHEIFNTEPLESLPYEALGVSFVNNAVVIGVSQYINGDLLVVFHAAHTFPYGAGVARIDRDGHPLWSRRDYSHHWPHLMADQRALVPSHRIGEKSIPVPFWRRTIYLCKTGKPLLDFINVLDEDGRLLEQISVIDAILDSPYDHVLRETSDECDPTHLNYVDQIGGDGGDMVGAAPGDMVVSLRNLSAFGILDGETAQLKRLVRGSFVEQHAVQHWKGSKFLLFDNHGSDGVYGPSRLLEVDLSDGRERTIFPNRRTPDFLRLFTNIHGAIDIAPDGRRAIFTASDQGMAVEVRLADGEVLNIFQGLHDVSKFDEFSEAKRTIKSAVFETFEVRYAKHSRD